MKCSADSTWITVLYTNEHTCGKIRPRWSSCPSVQIWILHPKQRPVCWPLSTHAAKKNFEAFCPSSNLFLKPCAPKTALSSNKSKPPAKPVAWLGPIRAWYRQALLAPWKPGNRTIVTGGHPHRVAALFALFCRLTRKRVDVFFHTYLFDHLILFYLILYILLYCSFVSPYCIYKIPSTPEVSIPIFVF